MSFLITTRYTPLFRRSTPKCFAKRFCATSNHLQGSILGIGNPLLDISTEVPEDFLKRYNLKSGHAVLAGSAHLPLFQEIQSGAFKLDYIAGGSAQNTIRAVQWMLQTPGATSFLGCVGQDKNAQLLKKAAESASVKPIYMVDPVLPTGRCAALIYNKERSLVASLGAAQSYNKTHFDTTEVIQAVSKAKYFYAEGFFLSVSPQTLAAMATHSTQNNKCFMLNLSAVFVVEHYIKELRELLPKTQVLFGNENEAEHLGKLQGWGTDLKEIALKTAKSPQATSEHPRTVVFTQGPKSIIVARMGKVYEFPTVPLPPSQVVDTNGAGDSFVGGFLSQYVLGKPLETCIRAGQYAAADCIRHSGCNFSPVPMFK